MTVEEHINFAVNEMLCTLKVELCDVSNGKCTAKATGSINLFGAVKRFVVLKRVSLPARRKGVSLHKTIWFDEKSKLSSPNEGTIFSPVRVEGGIR